MKNLIFAALFCFGLSTLTAATVEQSKPQKENLMKTIQEFPLHVLAIDADKDQTIEMPSGAQIIGVAATFNGVVIAARVDDKRPIEKRTFRVYRTGEEANEYDLHPIGSIQTYGQPGGSLLHIFENKRL